MITSSMLARQITALRALAEELTPSLRYSCGLFGSPKKLNPHKISNFQTLFAKHPGCGVSLRHPCVLCVSAISLLVDFLTLCFHNLTNPFSRNPFPFTSMQNPGVWGRVPHFRSNVCQGMGLRNRGQMGSGSKKGKISARTKLMKIFSPFNAVYRHSMRRNTIQRKVWSHIANSGTLDVESLGGSALLFHLWVHLRPGRHILTSGN